jgi:putative endopeptidase
MLLQIIQIWQLILKIKQNRCFNAFSVVVTEDFKTQKQYTLMTWQGGLGLPERE